MKSKDEIFEGKSFQDLTHDIYKNTTDRKKQIDLLISEIHGFITTIDDVILVAPIIKEYMEVAVKNDEHLVKLAGVLQRIISKSMKLISAPMNIVLKSMNTFPTSMNTSLKISKK